MKRFFALLLSLMLLWGVALAEESDMLLFRPVDCGIQALDAYEYPFMGMSFTLSQTMLKKIDSREVFVMPMEDYLDANTIRYAGLRFSTTSEEQRTQEGMSVDFYAWEEGLNRLGAIGVYHKDAVAELDSLTGCDVHTKLGESEDGTFQYYRSVSSGADSALAAELEQTQVTITTMAALNMEDGNTAFSEARVEGVNTVGAFTTEDIFGNAYTQAYFQQYDLTLVNLFATWCSPCVKEMPELEKLRQAFAEQGVKLGVVAVVLDAKTVLGVDEGAVERAQALYKASKAQFPFLLPDESEMNGRLTGVEAVPESFFVAGNGSIVGETYVGARSLEAWTAIVNAELADLGVSP